VKIIACLVGITLLLAGCSGSKANTSTAAATAAAKVAPTPTSTPSPSPTVWTMKEAGSKYLALVTPGNALTKQANALKPDDFSGWKTISMKITNADDTLARGLTNGLWPAPVRAKIDLMTPLVLKERVIWQAMAATTSMSALDSAAVGLDQVNTEATAAATAVRIALGLPSN